MDLCAYISEFKRASGIMAAHYAVSATFGNTNDEDFYKLLQVRALINTLESNIPRYRKVKKLMQGQFVSLSSLKRENNKLILDSSPHECVDIEVRRCLSDSEVCKIVETLQIICNIPNC